MAQLLEPTDWSITRSNGNIRYIGDGHLGTNPSYATVIEFHRWLSDLADDASSGVSDDQHDITDDTSSDRSTDNIITLLGSYNIDATASQHLYDGSIIQGSGGTQQFYDGIVNFGTQGIRIQIIQNGAVLTDDWWNVVGAGSPGATTGLNASVENGITHRFMIPTRIAGADIDGRRLLGTSRTFGNTYSEFSINGTARGNNVLALAESNDLNNETAIGTVAGWTGISNLTEGYIGIDVDNNAVNEFYYSQWNTNQPTRSINDFYERLKWISRDTSYDDLIGSPQVAQELYGIPGELFRGITHELNVNTPTGTFSSVGPVEWGSPATGTGQMLAINSPTAATKMWIQLLTGVIPSGTQTIQGFGVGSPGTVEGTVNLNTTVTARTIATPFVGQSTGSALIGSYGFGVEASDLTAADKVFDLTNTQITPPNNVTFTVFGVAAGEDRVLVTNDAGSAIDTTQLSLAVTLSGATVTEVQVTTSIPTDTPGTGTIRIVRDDGLESRHVYTSYEVGSPSNTFTIGDVGSPTNGYDFSGNNATSGNGVYVSYIDRLAVGSPISSTTTETFTVVYLSDRTLFIRVRDGGTTGDNEGIKTFETTGTLGSSGGSSTAIRTSDV